MAQPPSLFDAPATRGASRRTDPPTSRAAGRSVADEVLTQQQEDVMRGIGGMGQPENFTAYEVWQHLDSTFYRRPDGSVVGRIKENVVSKRLGELRDLGRLRVTDQTRPGSSHRHQQAFALTDKGREWLAGAA